MSEDIQQNVLFERVSQILEEANSQAARTVNTTMVHAYWFIGREIVEHEQDGEKRAQYGAQLIKTLSKQLTERFGRGFSAGNVKRMKQFYELEAAREAWSVRELERQFGSLLFERPSMSRDKQRIRELANEGLQISKPTDIIKDPFVLEFLGLDEHAGWLEQDLESAILDHLESFLLELGKGFCFVARQRRLTLDGDHHRVDLVFYNRLLRCFVLVDLKLGKLTHQDLGQMLMYVNYYDNTQRTDDEHPTIGIVLCSDKNDAMARITLSDNEQIFDSRYKLYLPTEDELRQEVIHQRERIEQAHRLFQNDESSDAD